MNADEIRILNWNLYVEAASLPGISDRVFGAAVRASSGCLERSNRYAKISIRGKHILVHRLALLIGKGPFDPSSDVDHLCRNPKCVDPNHLEAVPHAENVRRGSSATRTTGPCKRGHDDWVRYASSQGRGACRTCNIENKRALRSSKKTQLVHMNDARNARTVNNYTQSTF